MKHELDERLHASVRRELREPPAGLPERVRARIDATPVLLRADPARRLPWRAAASLAAAGLLAYALWPRATAPLPGQTSPPSREVLEVVDLTQQGIEYTARADRPLADEWQLMVQNSLQLCDALLGQLPNLPR
jgi:hypothetical protein